MRLDGHEKQGSVPSFAMSHLVSERITDFPALQAIREDWQTLTARLPENTDFFAKKNRDRFICCRWFDF